MTLPKEVDIAIYRMVNSSWCWCSNGMALTWMTSALVRARPFSYRGPAKGMIFPPPCVSKLSIVELSGKSPADCSRRMLEIGEAFCDRMSMFDPGMRDQRSNFRETGIFINFASRYLKTTNRSDMKLSPACSPLGSE